MNNRDNQPKAQIVDGQIHVTIGIDNMANAIQFGNYLLQFEEGEYVIDADVLAKSIVNQLTAEEEDGTTLIHTMIDRAVEVVCENGEYGIDFDDE